MKVYYQCAPCFLRQAKEALDMATTDDSVKLKTMEKLTHILGADFKREAASNKIGTRIHRTIKKETGNEDPYLIQKEKCNQIAWQFLPTVTELLKKDGSLKNYIKAAITGNIIDFGALGLDVDIEALIKDNMKKDLVVDDSAQLEEELKRVHKVLYLVDNIGEIVFDKLLIEKIKEFEVEVMVAVKEKPILNDACLPDALLAGLDQVAEITTTGTDSIGIIYEDLSPQFREEFWRADLIIAKGLGNYEGLDEIELGDKPVFCLLNVKCEPIAINIGAKLGDNVVIKL